MTNESRRRLRKRWWLYCSAGFIVGHVLFGLIGHGFTGPHEGRPTGVSAVAHTAGLLVLGLIVFSAHRVGLKPWLQITDKRLIIATLSFVAAFQLGAYALRPPFDYVFGMPVLGVAAWIGRDRLRGSKGLWTAAAAASFWLSLVVVPIIFYVLASVAWEPDSSSLTDHIVMWLIGGGTTGVVGGYVSGWPLSRLLTSSTDVGAA